MKLLRRLLHPDNYSLIDWAILAWMVVLGLYGAARS